MCKRLLFVAGLLCWSLTSSAFADQKEWEVVGLGFDIEGLDLKPFYKGYYGKVGTSSLFIGLKKDIPDRDRLYWAIVQVLSQKYGCLMRLKMNRFPYTSFLCKDERIVVFHTRDTGDYYLFSGRQFDRQGQEIVVKNKKIIGRYPMFEASFPTQLRNKD